MDARKREFGRRIQARLTDRGWRQADLAREATKHMPRGDTMTRDNISNYVRGMQVPGKVRLKALTLALGCKDTDLMPPGLTQSVDDMAPPLNVKALGENRVFLQINQVTSMDIAMKIMSMLQSNGDEK